MTFKILIVDDEEDLREILGYFCSAEFKSAQISFAANGEIALQKLLADKDYQLVISDYKMPTMDGNELYFEIKNNSAIRHIPFVFCTAYVDDAKKFNEYVDCFFWITKPDIINGIKSLALKLKDHTSNIKKDSPYFPVSIDFLNIIKEMNCPVFIKISEDKFVKIFNESDFFSFDDFEKYQQKKISHLYILNSDNLKIFNSISSYLKSGQWVNENQNCQYAPVSQVIVDCLKLYHFSPIAVENAKKYIMACTTHIEKIKDLKICVEKILKNPNSYIAKHVSLLTLFSFEMVMSLDWKNSITLQKLALAALLHDIELDEMLTDDLTASDIENLSRKNKENYLNHPIKGSEIIRKFSEIPPDIDRIILEHHEWPDGSGFPRKLTANQIGPLSAVFISAHLAASQILTKNNIGQAKSKDEILAVLNENLNKGPFKKILDAFKKS